MASAADDEAQETTPWHVWAVGVAGLLWNAFPAVDYTMTRLQVASWLADMPLAMLAAIEAFPLWVSLAWALGVWGSFFGAVLLLMRRSWALWSFLASLVGLAALNLYLPRVGVPTQPVLLITITCVLLLEIYYCWRQVKSGVLR